MGDLSWDMLLSIAGVTSIIVGGAVVYINLKVVNAIQALELRLDDIYMRTKTILNLFEKMGTRVGDVEDKQEGKQEGRT